SEGARRRQVAPVRWHEAPDAAAFLINQDQNVVADRVLGLGDQPTYLVGYLAVAGEQNQPARAHARQEARLIGGQDWPGQAGDEGSMHSRTLYRPCASIAAGQVDAKVRQANSGLGVSRSGDSSIEVDRDYHLPLDASNIPNLTVRRESRARLSGGTG